MSFVSGKGEKVQEEVVQVACGAHHNLALFRGENRTSGAGHVTGGVGERGSA